MQLQFTEIGLRTVTATLWYPDIHGLPDGPPGCSVDGSLVVRLPTPEFKEVLPRPSVAQEPLLTPEFQEVLPRSSVTQEPRSLPDALFAVIRGSFFRLAHAAGEWLLDF